MSLVNVTSLLVVADVVVAGVWAIVPTLATRGAASSTLNSARIRGRRSLAITTSSGATVPTLYTP